MEAGMSTSWKNKPEIRCKAFGTNSGNAEIDISRSVTHGRSACMYIYYWQKVSPIVHEGRFC